MEPTTTTAVLAPAPGTDVYERATQLLMTEKRAPATVRDTLMAEGVDLETADEVVGNLELQLDAARKERARKDMLYGGLWCVGGIVMTLADVGYIFWGAIVFGGIQLFRGMANS